MDYYVGLDIGTNSVGWAVTDRQYNLIKAPVKGKYKNHDMWGIRLFEAGNTAAERRMARATRRRLERRVNRIQLLQELLASEMYKVDSTFFLRLNESRLHSCDKTDSISNYRFPLFNDKDYTDKEYYDQYPTIYHLRYELMTNTDKHDLRLVYLALHHIIKYRGHFLIDGDVSSTENFEEPFDQMMCGFNDYGLNISCASINSVKEILQDKKSANSIRKKTISELFSISENSEESAGIDSKLKKGIIENIAALLVGLTADIAKIFINDTFENDITTKFAFSNTKYEDEIKDLLYASCPDIANWIENIKLVYDWALLAEIKGEATYISEAKINCFEKHQKNLRILQRLFREYNANEYKEFFHSKKDKSATYAGYIGKGGCNTVISKCSEEDFYKALSKTLMNMVNVASNEDKEIINDFIVEATNHTLLPVQRNRDNSVIPHQLHEQELRKILDNVKTYYPFFDEKGEDGLSLSEKIISIFKFRIPYYVGPLSDRHKEQGANQWMVRKPGQENVKITPWNFDDVVDRNKSNEVFIQRMTNKCTYLNGEDVLPKNSLLYSKYMVLNELNNLKINDHKLTVSDKQKIYEELFMQHKKVTRKKLLQYLNGYMPKENSIYMDSDITGIDGDFKASLSSYLDFKNILGDALNNSATKKVVEKIIFWKTIYGDDSKMVAEAIKQSYPTLFSHEQIKAIGKLKYSGWGNFSYKFLNEIEGYPREGTGEMITVINALWESNYNLMQLLSSDFYFSKEIQRINQENCQEICKISYDNLIKPLYVSPSVKKSIWQTIKIVEEITKIMGCAPTKIFVEMARDLDQKKGERTTPRKQALINLYKTLVVDNKEEFIKDIEQYEDRQFSSKRLYLYFVQQGRCAYTGNKIDLSELMNGSSKWDIDHIYPQSKIKDDSWNNLVLAERSANIEKGNGLVPEIYRNRMKATWTAWAQGGKNGEEGFISKEKYRRLVRSTPFDEEEKAGFVARQLVETRQSSKVVCDLFQRMYGVSGSKIVQTKAGLASQFRKDPLNCLKSRRANDYHHAKDAYLNIVVGDVYNTKYTDNPRKWMREKGDNVEYSVTRTMYWDVYDRQGNLVWKGCDKEKYTDEGGENHYRYKHRWTDENGEIQEAYLKGGPGEIIGGDLDRVREIVKKNTCMYTEATYCGHGQLFNLTQLKKGSAGITIPLKGNLPPERYGGYNSATTAYFALIEYDGKKARRAKLIVGVPIIIANQLGNNPNAFVDYCALHLGLINVKVLIPQIKKNSLMIVNGLPMRIRGESGANLLFKCSLQPKFTKVNEEIIRKVERVIEKKDKDNNYVVNGEYDGIFVEDLKGLYDEICNKLSTLYKSRPSNQVENLRKYEESFLALDLKDQCIVINNMLYLIRCDTCTSANLTLIGGTSIAGSISAKKNPISNGEPLLVNQSVTGLFEKRILL